MTIKITRKKPFTKAEINREAEKLWKSKQIILWGESKASVTGVDKTREAYEAHPSEPEKWIRKAVQAKLLAFSTLLSGLTIEELLEMHRKDQSISIEGKKELPGLVIQMRSWFKKYHHAKNYKKPYPADITLYQTAGLINIDDMLRSFMTHRSGHQIRPLPNISKEVAEPDMPISLEELRDIVDTASNPPAKFQILFAAQTALRWQNQRLIKWTKDMAAQYADILSGRRKEPVITFRFLPKKTSASGTVSQRAAGFGYDAIEKGLKPYLDHLERAGHPLEVGDYLFRNTKTKDQMSSETIGDQWQRAAGKYITLAKSRGLALRRHGTLRAFLKKGISAVKDQRMNIEDMRKFISGEAMNSNQEAAYLRASSEEVFKIYVDGRYVLNPYLAAEAYKIEAEQTKADMGDRIIKLEGRLEVMQGSIERIHKRLHELEEGTVNLDPNPPTAGAAPPKVTKKMAKLILGQDEKIADLEQENERLKVAYTEANR